ncbi:MAG TPA: TniQ family protein [Candidatus Acidoferrales bacterium]|nr:TniQ family protein [Candidatus Acidoferrales bacterium]
MTESTRHAMRRLAPIPVLHPDETLGSWIDRLARGQHATRDELVRALCAENDIDRALWDLDTDAPSEFLARLGARTGVRLSALRRLMVPGGAPLMAGEGEPHCPVCWLDPAERYVRREWRAVEHGV